MEYELQLDYLKQEKTRFLNKINNIYERFSNDEWELVSYIYYETPTACDYPKCSRGTPENGIKHVYRIINRETKAQLNLGSTCYLKFFLDKEKVSSVEKQGFEKEVASLFKSRQKLEKDVKEIEKKYQQLIAEMQEKQMDLKRKSDKLGLELNFEIDTNFSSNTHSENLRIAAMLDKYQVELKQLERMKKNEKIQMKVRERQKKELEMEEKILDEYPEMTQELLTFYLFLVSFCSTEKVDGNGECYVDYEASLIAQSLNRDIPLNNS